MAGCIKPVKCYVYIQNSNEEWRGIQTDSIKEAASFVWQCKSNWIINSITGPYRVVSTADFQNIGITNNHNKPLLKSVRNALNRIR